jgi:hypothetical protein
MNHSIALNSQELRLALTLRFSGSSFPVKPDGFSTRDTESVSTLVSVSQNCLEFQTLAPSDGPLREPEHQLIEVSKSRVQASSPEGDLERCLRLISSDSLLAKGPSSFTCMEGNNALFEGSVGVACDDARQATRRLHDVVTSGDVAIGGSEHLVEQDRERESSVRNTDLLIFDRVLEQLSKWILLRLEPTMGGHSERGVLDVGEGHAIQIATSIGKCGNGAIGEWKGWVETLSEEMRRGRRGDERGCYYEANNLRIRFREVDGWSKGISEDLRTDRRSRLV